MPTFETPEPVSARVETAHGSVRIVAGDRTDTVVAVRPGDESRGADVWAAEHTRVDFHDGRLTVSGARRGVPHFRGGAVAIDIALPSRSRLYASLASASLRTEGELGDVRISSSSGEIEVDSVTGKLKAANASGSLMFRSVAGGGSVSTASGDATIGDLDGELRFKAASGSVTVARLRGQLKARTASGSVEIEAAVRGEVSAQTSSGEVILGVCEGTAVRLDIVTGSGVVTNTLEPSDGPQDGDETFLLAVRSGSGDVSIRRANPAHEVLGPAT
jgi:Putative adhesin